MYRLVLEIPFNGSSAAVNDQSRSPFYFSNLYNSMMAFPKSIWNHSEPVKLLDMEEYLNYLRRDEFHPTKFPDHIRSKVMQYVYHDWSISLHANETNTDIHNRCTQFETGTEIQSCTSTAAAIYHFLCNRHATGYDVKSLSEISGKKDFNGLPIELQRMGPTLFIFHTKHHKFSILRVNEGISCIIHSNQDEFSQPIDYSSDPKFTLHEYLNPDLFPPCFIMDDHFVPKPHDVPSPVYSPDIEPLYVNVNINDEVQHTDRIRRFIQFRNDNELLQFFNDMKRTRESSNACPDIYERYFGMRFQYDMSQSEHWFIEVSLPPLPDETN